MLLELLWALNISKKKESVPYKTVNLDAGMTDYELFMCEVFGAIDAEPTIAKLGDLWFDDT